MTGEVTFSRLSDSWAATGDKKSHLERYPYPPGLHGGRGAAERYRLEAATCAGLWLDIKWWEAPGLGRERDGTAGGDVGRGGRDRDSGDTKARFREELWEPERGRVWRWSVRR